MADSKPSRVEIASRSTVLENANLTAEVAALTAGVERLTKERNDAQSALRTVQNAAKTLAAAQGTELEHLRQNATFDHRLRAEHDSLLERDAQMTDALLAAEARAEAAEAELAKLREAEPVAQWRVGEWKNGSTPDTAIIFCDAHETAITMVPLPRKQAQEIVESHNDCLTAPTDEHALLELVEQGVKAQLASAPGAVRGRKRYALRGYLEEDERGWRPLPTPPKEGDAA